MVTAGTFFFSVNDSCRWKSHYMWKISGVIATYHNIQYSVYVNVLLIDWTMKELLDVMPMIGACFCFVFPFFFLHVAWLVK